MQNNADVKLLGSQRYKQSKMQRNATTKVKLLGKANLYKKNNCLGSTT